ncbi:hypothetical protein FZEAL_4620 [Fusarium zealandicum]|uniref:Xylanolytic transcriptional activator regulatory domain-containing protein n=1 Tax=Fusarium zealandicum TaxID=1053134 RepID=A0A8H4XLQ5_9HYPO|nr:hypothetical protein FZEAL_4620 [Fusarium zealandicum]
MEFHGIANGTRPDGRPPIARRSHGRIQASSLQAKGLDFSTVVGQPRPSLDCYLPNLLTWCSTSSEQKIDDIAHDIDGIKLILEGLNIPKESTRPSNSSTTQPAQQNEPQKLQIRPGPGHSGGTNPSWDHSAHVVDFVRAVIDDKDSSSLGYESSQVISSLRNLVNALQSSDGSQSLIPTAMQSAQDQTNTPMPPLDSVVEILRWAKAHCKISRIQWICKILPLEKFEEICCKVYFVVNDYTQVDFIIANSFLSYMFAEHAVIYGVDSSQQNCNLCRSNLGTSLSRLPLLLPASMEVVVALTLGSLHSIEDSRASRAWTLISSALNVCQTLGYHRLGSATGSGNLHETQRNLFWAVFSFENGLSLRLGRSSGIRDSDIALSIDPDEPRSVKTSRIQRKVYDQLYSPAGLSSSAAARGWAVQTLSAELRVLIEATRADISDAASQTGDSQLDPMRILYLQCDLVCQSSFLVLILKAKPAVQHPKVSDECIGAAREVMDMHQQCMKSVQSCMNPLLVAKYITWAVMHTPFVPFTLLFTRTVQLFDYDDLSRLERFAASLKPDAADVQAITHPHRLYELLCQAARLYIDANLYSALNNEASTMTDTAFSSSLEHLDMTAESGDLMQSFSADYSSLDFTDWYYGNQQLMTLLDGDMTF